MTIADSISNTRTAVISRRSTPTVRVGEQASGIGLDIRQSAAAVRQSAATVGGDVRPAGAVRRGAGGRYTAVFAHHHRQVRAGERNGDCGGVHRRSGGATLLGGLLFYRGIAPTAASAYPRRPGSRSAVALSNAPDDVAVYEMLPTPLEGTADDGPEPIGAGRTRWRRSRSELRSKPGTRDRHGPWLALRAHYGTVRAS